MHTMSSLELDYNEDTDSFDDVNASEDSSGSEREDSDEVILETQPHYGGYDYEFVDEVLPSQKCAVCLLPMKDAVQTKNCGHRFCKTCIERSLSNGNDVCPNGRCQITGPKGFYDDKAFARDILCLRVKCKQEEMGCNWIGQVAEAEQHQKECPREKEDCDACGEQVQRRLLETHMATECPQRTVECDYCGDQFLFSSKQEHEEKICIKFPLSCLNNCGQTDIPRKMMAIHLSQNCPMTEVGCPYAEAGCAFKDKRANLSDHIVENVKGHLDLTWFPVLNNLKILNEKVDGENTDLKAAVSNSFEKFTEELALVRDELALAREELAFVREDNKKLREMVANLRAKGENDSVVIKNIGKAVSALKAREYARPAPY